jgi:glutamate synthase (NADPH/NADH) large chain
MVSLSTDLESADEAAVRRLVENHASYTDSLRAQELLANWSAEVENFTKVMPDAYARVIEEEGRADVRESLPPAAEETRVAVERDAGVVSGDD